MASSQGVRALDLLRAGIVDRIVPEYPDAADEPAAYLRRVATALEGELIGLLRRDPATRLAARLARYRSLGLVGP
jgi:acetyl-CoA carboxylase carboxyl transferase subunit beta